MTIAIVRRGRRPLPYCTARFGIRHRLNGRNRRWKYYVRKDGTAALLENGCASCNSLGNARRRGENAVEQKLRRILKETA